MHPAGEATDHGGADDWKGFLKIGEVACPVALFTAASAAERIGFHIMNRKSGHRVHREYVDAETGERVDAKDQVKGYETGAGDYIAFEPEEIAKAVPEADKTLDVQVFLPCDQVDDVYFDRPYYLAPSTPAGAEAYLLIRDGMAAANVVAVARTVLFRRVRSVLIRSHGQGLIANTLNLTTRCARPTKRSVRCPAPRRTTICSTSRSTSSRKRRGGSTPRSSMTATTRPCSNW
jgi:DNA end-binding protein Ku